MLKEKKSSGKPVTLSGKALISTIATMDTLGIIGQDVLRANGILALEAEKQYPYEIRNAIHKAVFDRYGEIALLMVGHLNAESLVDSNMIKPILARAVKLESKLISSAETNYVSALAEIVKLYIKCTDEQVKIFTFGGDIDYGNKAKRLSPYSWEIENTLAMELFQEPFCRAIIDYIFTRAIGRYFEWSLDYKVDKSHTDYGYATWVWQINFRRHLSTHTSYEIFVARNA